MNDDDRFLLAFAAIIYSIFFLGMCSVEGGNYRVMTYPDVMWINEAKSVKSTNPFFTKGIIITLDGRSLEIGFRNDGIMVWRDKR